MPSSLIRQDRSHLLMGPERPRIWTCRATRSHVVPIFFTFRLIAPLILGAFGLSATGCGKHAAADRHPQPIQSARVVVVAPVLNLSGTSNLDVLKVSDAAASEFLAFPGVAVVPINITLAKLAEMGKRQVDSPAEAVSLARAFGADATIVIGITEYDPYNPPVIGMVMQWYDAGQTGAAVASDAGAAPARQVQRVFNARHDWVQSEVREYNAKRQGDESPFGWRGVLQSQERYVRYCCWSVIRTMLSQSGESAIEQ